jgi:hypothetical protein
VGARIAKIQQDPAGSNRSIIVMSAVTPARNPPATRSSLHLQVQASWVQKIQQISNRREQKWDQERSDEITRKVVLNCENDCFCRSTNSSESHLQRRGQRFEPSTAHLLKHLVSHGFLNRMDVRKRVLLAPRSAHVPQANSKSCLLCSAQNAVVTVAGMKRDSARVFWPSLSDRRRLVPARKLVASSGLEWHWAT